MRKRYEEEIIEKDRRITRRSERNLQTEVKKEEERITKRETGEKETLCRKNEKIRKETARSR